MFANLALIFVTRSRERTLLDTPRQPNPAFWWIVAGGLAALAAAIYLPPVAAVFQFSALGTREIAVAAGADLSAVAWYEIWKALRR